MKKSFKLNQVQYFVLFAFMLVIAIALMLFWWFMFDEMLWSSTYLFGVASIHLTFLNFKESKKILVNILLIWELFFFVFWFIVHNNIFFLSLMIIPLYLFGLWHGIRNVVKEDE